MGQTQPAPSSVNAAHLTALNNQIKKITEQVKLTEHKIKEIEQIKVRQPNSALFYFDQEKRQEILRSNNVQTAEQAYNLIKASFDALINTAKHDYIRFEKMAAQDHDRF